MERNLIYLNNCAVLPGGKVNSFLMQEAKWLTGHFERAFVVSHSGFGSCIIQTDHMHRVHVGDQDNCKLRQLVLLHQIQVHLCQQFTGVNGIAHLVLCPEAGTIQGNRIDADMHQHFQPVRRFNAVSVQGILYVYDLSGNR